MNGTNNAFKDYGDQLFRLETNLQGEKSLILEKKNLLNFIKAKILKKDEYSLEKIVNYINSNPAALDLMASNTKQFINARVKKYNAKRTGNIPAVNENVNSQASFLKHAVSSVHPISKVEPSLREVYDNEMCQTEAFTEALLKGESVEGEISSPESLQAHKDCAFFNEVVADLKDVSKETYGSAEFRAKVVDLLDRADSKLQLKMIAYALFANMNRTVSTDHNGNEIALFYLLNDPLSKKNDVSNVMLRLMQTVAKRWKKDTAMNSDNAAINRKAVQLSTEKASEIVEATHGGGLFFLLEFMKGKSEGYTALSEYDGAGIFLYAKEGNDDLFYAKKSMLHFDIPTRLKLKVPKNSLEGSNVVDEVLLRKDHVESLQIISLKPLKADNLILDDVTYTDGFLEYFEEELKERIRQSEQNMGELRGILSRSVQGIGL